MSYLTSHWTFDPIVVVCAIAAGLHGVGLHRRGGTDEARHPRRALLFYGGIMCTIIAVDSPIDHWAYDYFFVHMIEHILLMVFAPVLIVLGAPWTAMVHAAPEALRQRLRRSFAYGPRSSALRGVWSYLSAPWTALLMFNLVMVVWHLPGPLDLAQRTRNVYVWLMQGSFLATGLMFWLQIIPSPPFRRRASAVWKIGAIVSTNVVMFVLAMALSIFTNHSWYSAYEHVPGVTLSPFADQQIGAAILWICGDFWAVPSLIFVIRSAVAEEGSVSGLLEALVSHHQSASHTPTAAAGNWPQEAEVDGLSGGAMELARGVSEAAPD